jgi:transmembrane sensor
MDTKKAQDLINKFHQGILSVEEEAMLDSWYLSLSEDEQASITDEDLQERKLAILNRLDKVYRKRITIKLWQRIAGVAAAVAAIVFGVWFFSAPRHAELVSASPNYTNDVAPGKNTATLTLANGKVISLSDAKTGVVVGANKLAYNDGTAVDPLTGSSLRGGTTKQPPFGDEVAASRSAPRNDGQDDVVVSTPRGGQYQITLPDGTRVWLNADSKISFPSQFIGKERKVLLLNGEAYFEVAKVVAPATGEVAAARSGRPRNDVRVPFIVESRGQEVEVLGTHFNINAYSDEGSTKTTLLEGSVRVSSLRAPDPSLRGGTTRQSQDEVAASRRAPRNDGRSSDEWGDNGQGGNSEVLKPGQQAVLTANTKRFKVQEVDVNDVIDWKNGEFIFNDEPLENIMRKVARWYDVEVEYHGVDPKKRFWGSISRFENVSKVLEKLELTGGLHFKIEGKKIIAGK